MKSILKHKGHYGHEGKVHKNLSYPNFVYFVPFVFNCFPIIFGRTCPSKNERHAQRHTAHYIIWGIIPCA
jgi:hypothetical protein